MKTDRTFPNNKEDITILVRKGTSLLVSTVIERRQKYDQEEAERFENIKTLKQKYSECGM
jgi:hypothetical protein